jgi:hypothetical protein
VSAAGFTASSLFYGARLGSARRKKENMARSSLFEAQKWLVRHLASEGAASPNRQRIEKLLEGVEALENNNALPTFKPPSAQQIIDSVREADEQDRIKWDSKEHCVLEIKSGKYCGYHQTTEDFHNHCHRLDIDKEDALTHGERQRLRKYAQEFLPRFGQLMKSTLGVSSTGYAGEAHFIMTMLDEFNKLQ